MKWYGHTVRGGSLDEQLLGLSRFPARPTAMPLQKLGRAISDLFRNKKKQPATPVSLLSLVVCYTATWFAVQNKLQPRSRSRRNCAH